MPNQWEPLCWQRCCLEKRFPSGKSWVVSLFFLVCIQSIAAGRGSIESKLEALDRAGVPVAEQPADVVPLVQQALGR